MSSDDMLAHIRVLPQCSLNSNLRWMFSDSSWEAWETAQYVPGKPSANADLVPPTCLAQFGSLNFVVLIFVVFIFVVLIFVVLIFPVLGDFVIHAAGYRYAFKSAVFHVSLLQATLVGEHAQLAAILLLVSPVFLLLITCCTLRMVRGWSEWKRKSPTERELDRKLLVL